MPTSSWYHAVLKTRNSLVTNWKGRRLLHQTPSATHDFEQVSFISNLCHLSLEISFFFFLNNCLFQSSWRVHSARLVIPARVKGKAAAAHCWAETMTMGIERSVEDLVLMVLTDLWYQTVTCMQNCLTGRNRPIFCAFIFLSLGMLRI